MPAYILFDNLEVRDADKLARYKELAAPIVARHGGRYVVLGGPAQVLEGSQGPTFPVMIEFDNAGAARRWYDSDDYRPLRAMRLEAVRSTAVLLEGLAQPAEDSPRSSAVTTESASTEDMRERRPAQPEQAAAAHL